MGTLIYLVGALATIGLIAAGVLMTFLGITDNLIFHNGWFSWLEIFFIAGLTYIIAFGKKE